MKKLLYIALLLSMLSCSPLKEIVEVPVEIVRTEYVHDTRIDSVYLKDSVDRYIKGDTVFIYKERTKYKYLNKTDTVVRVDSIPKIIKVEVVKEVEVNHIKWYQKAFMWIGGIMFLILTGYIIYKVKFE